MALSRRGTDHGSVPHVSAMRRDGTDTAFLHVLIDTGRDDEPRVGPTTGPARREGRDLGPGHRPAEAWKARSRAAGSGRAACPRCVDIVKKLSPSGVRDEHCSDGSAKAAQA